MKETYCFAQVEAEPPKISLHGEELRVRVKSYAEDRFAVTAQVFLTRMNSAR
jgi:hypothetical protein